MAAEMALAGDVTKVAEGEPGIRLKTSGNHSDTTVDFITDSPFVVLTAML